ncbi:MAG: RNA polymerase subunit sigma-24 [Candidatus Zixiibacteriota bacterium]|nr:MAG: RNA polymerase subunit sigma-24 [candidate division Zixibacteria bacterium]
MRKSESVTGDILKSQNSISEPSTWIDKYGDFLYSYAMSRLNDRSVSEDVVQETFLAALKAKDNFAGASSEKTWFIGILKNKIIDYIRRASKETDLENLDSVSGEESDFIRSGPMAGSWTPQRRPADWKIDSDDLVEKKEFWKFLHYCLSVLPEKMAMIFKLREMEEEKPEKICNDLKISSTNLRVIMYRARLQMRTCLEKNWIGITK